MFVHHKILVSCLMLAALFASGANADTIFIDPGFGNSGDTWVFTDNKTLTYEAGVHWWFNIGVPGNLVFTGSFIDLNLQPITSVPFAGRTVGENDPISLGATNPQEKMVFRGFVIITRDPTEAFDIDWGWDASDRPLVGEGVEPPPSGVDLTGTVQDQGGAPLCSLAMASGQFMFTCNPNGPYELLDLPTETDGTVKMATQFQQGSVNWVWPH